MTCLHDESTAGSPNAVYARTAGIGPVLFVSALLEVDLNMARSHTVSLEIDREAHNSIIAGHLDFVVELPKDLTPRVGPGRKGLEVNILRPRDLA